ncbi:MAG: hypothetical protein DCF30_19735 [Hyphomicrobiales bacterium]|nr:MAG: hypothetical protein DCF30_19735 [Hyphomicrobiales bacterium]
MTLRAIPKFQSEADERAFWETHDSNDYVDWRKAKRVPFPRLRPACLGETAAASVPDPEPRSNSSASALHSDQKSIGERTDR